MIGKLIPINIINNPMARENTLFLNFKIYCPIQNPTNILLIYIFVIYISRIFVGFWIGQYILKFKNKVFSLAIGLLIIFIGINLPIIGTFIHFMVIVIGLGAIILTVYDIYRKTKQENSFL